MCWNRHQLHATEFYCLFCRSSKVLHLEIFAGHFMLTLCEVTLGAGAHRVLTCYCLCLPLGAVMIAIIHFCLVWPRNKGKEPLILTLNCRVQTLSQQQPRGPTVRRAVTEGIFVNSCPGLCTTTDNHNDNFVKIGAVCIKNSKCMSKFRERCRLKVTLTS